jgi:hypothetical protein
MNAIEKIDGEIAALHAEIVQVEHALPSSAERFAVVESELLQAAEVYRSRGLNPSAAHPGETVYLQRQALIGMAMVIGAEKILKIERQRIEQAGEGMSAADKARKLEQLRAQVEAAAARREFLVRRERDDFEIARPVPILAIVETADLERAAR